MFKKFKKRSIRFTPLKVLKKGLCVFTAQIFALLINIQYNAEIRRDEPRILGPFHTQLHDVDTSTQSRLEKAVRTLVADEVEARSRESLAPIGRLSQLIGHAASLARAER